ncbi:outer membrane protein assembly factor BamA [Paragemmobacter straminiformis]|uniref:Outer membrane protein assembly factor BamA n=1 Tax=Paragemmobacter straminiformis TaxID=2045119 RepID=A0A842I6Q5_9RHOB|nr:outer membrane protein assembly factor BamA [Gemmobacter straminiformis]MBC2835306.1 outer membrane protein assembly factor BamA [Gemmobacter straminiformis]
MQKNIQGRMVPKQGLLRPALVAAMLAGTALTAPMLTPAFAQSYSFSSVRVEGNATIETATVLSYLKIPRGAEISAAALNDAYQRLVDSGLFESVEIAPQGNELLVKVVEYPTISIVNFEGNKRLKDEDLAGIAKSQSRRVYSPSQAEADAAAIAEAYRLQGRMAATVDPRIIRRDGNRVDLVFEITEGKVVEIERLSFNGNRAFSDRRLRQVLQTKQAGLLRTFIQRDTFVAERLDLDKQLLRDFYLSRGYADVQVLDASSDIARERDAYFVTFSIREGQSFNIGKVDTVSEIEGVDAAEFEAVQRIRSGETWSPALIDNNVTRMENLALRKGLNFVRIDPRIVKNERDGTLDVQFAIVRGEKVFVERIDIEGNTTTLDQVIRRQFRTVEGDPFNPREIRQSAERIRALGFFKDAQVNAEPGSSSDQVVVNVDVEEQPTGSLSLGASYSVSDGVGLNVGFAESNFLGRGQSISANITSGTDSNSASFSFAEPAFLGRDVALKFSSAYRETNNQNAAYNTQSINITPALEFPISELGRLETRFSFAQSTLSGVDDTDSSQILTRDQDRGTITTSALGYTFSYDTRISGVNPKGGILLRFSQDFAGLGGNDTYLLTSGLALAENKILKEEVTVRAVFEGGALAMLGDDPSRVTNRFFGNNKIRGFESNGIGPRDLNAPNEDALGGNLYAVARFEAEFPLGLPEEYGINGGLFLDIGSVWSLDDTDGGAAGGQAVDDAFHLRSSIGFSVFWDTPIGPLRFNFSKALVKQDYDREQAFDLTISTKF